jgi:ribose transport system permease protein
MYEGMTKILGKAKLSSLKGRMAIRYLVGHENTMLVIILFGLVGVMAAITKGLTATLPNVSNIWVQSSTRGLAAIGQLFVIMSAGIDVSIGGIALLAAIVGAKLMTGQIAFPVSAIAAMLALGIGMGAINGGLVSRIGMPALIVTLGMWRITYGAGYMICRGVTIFDLPKSISIFGTGHIGGVPVPVIIFIATAVIAHFVLYRTTFGRSVFAVGGNATSAWLAGIDVTTIRFLVYVISGFLGSLAGLLTMARVMSGGLTTVAGLELDSIAAVCIGGVSLIGGKGTVIGAVIGTMIIGIVNNGMNVLAVNPAYQDIVKGSIIIVAVAIDFIRRR